jgi:hypothetical protein
MQPRPHSAGSSGASLRVRRADAWTAALATGALCIAACEYSHLVYLARFSRHRAPDLALLARSEPPRPSQKGAPGAAVTDRLAPRAGPTASGPFDRVPAVA